MLTSISGYARTPSNGALALTCFLALHGWRSDRNICDQGRVSPSTSLPNPN